MDINAVYSQIEDKYYAFLDTLDAKGVPIYKLVDPIEAVGMPSLPLAVGAILVVLGIIAYFFVLVPAAGITITVVDDNNNAVAGATVTVLYEGEEIISGETDSEGVFTAALPPKEVRIEAFSKDCPQVSYEIIDAGTEKEVTIKLVCKAVSVMGCSGLTEDKVLSTLADRDMNIPTGCVIRAYNANTDEPVQTPFKITPDGQLDISAEGACPTEDDEILIDCDDHEYSNTIKGMYDELDLFGYLQVNLKDEKLSGTPTKSVEVIRDINVKVSSSNTPLEGIKVKAVTVDGQDIPLKFSNIALSATTDLNGEAQLKLPDEQEFYLSAEDPQGAHEPTITDKYKATLSQSQSTISISLQSGFETIIIIKEESTQTPIPYAEVTVYDKATDKVIARGFADAQGRFKITLLKGQEYYYEAMNALYDSIKGSVFGDQDTTASMKQIDLYNTGDIIVDVISGHGMKLAFPDVRLMLMRNDANGTITWMRCTTDTHGRCYFSHVKEGSYYLEAIPPGDASKQRLADVGVNAQNTTYMELEVIPQQLRLKVITQVLLRGVRVPRGDVNVKLWDKAYQEKIEEKKSDRQTRSVSFTVDRGRNVFITADYIDEFGEAYGPTQLSLGELSTSQTLTITLQKITETVDVTIMKDGREVSGAVIPGERYTAELSISLPYFEGYETYEAATIELFVGEPGAVTDIKRTPIIIDPISLADITSQDPYIESLIKADEFEYGEDPKKNDAGTSKYLKINIGQYSEPKTYTVPVPVYVRELTTGKAVLNYRATWTTRAGDTITSAKGLWEIKEYDIGSAQSSLKSLDFGDFYAYAAWFTDSPEGDALTSITATKGGIFYAHVRAKARSDKEGWAIDVNNLPDKAEALYYEGTILRTEGGETGIARTEVGKSDFAIEGKEPQYALKKDDEADLTIAFKAIETGKATLTLLQDYDSPLAYEVTKAAKTGATQISGVDASLEAWSNFCTPEYDNDDTTGYKNGNCYFPYDVTDETLPTNSDKYIRLKLALNGDGTKDVRTSFEAADKSISISQSNSWRQWARTEDSEFQATIKSDEAVYVLARGNSITQNLLKVYVWEVGTDKPAEPWATITYGPVDYELKATPYEEGTVVDTLSENVDEIQLKLYKDEAGKKTVLGRNVLEGDKVFVDVGAFSGEAAITLAAEPYFRYVVDAAHPIPGGSDAVSIDAYSPNYFGHLKPTLDGVGVAFTPKAPAPLPFPDTITLGEEKEVKVQINSTWDKELGIDLGKLERPGYDIRLRVDTFKDGTALESYEGAELSKAVIPPKGDAMIIVKAKPISSQCRGEDKTRVLDVDIDEVRNTAKFAFDVDCFIPEDIGIIGKPAEGVKNIISREFQSGDRVTKDSCSVSGDATFAFVCDAEQFSLAVLDAADDLRTTPKAYEATYFYALGKDQVGADTLDEVLSAYGSRFSNIKKSYGREDLALGAASNDIIFEDTATCGVWQVTLQKTNLDEDVKVNITKAFQDKTTWCSRDSFGYLLGLLNVDKSLRPDYGMYYSFDSAYSGADFVKALQRAIEAGNNISESLLLGPESRGFEASTIVGERSGAQAAYFIKYRDCRLREASDCPTFARNQLGDRSAVGYLEVDEHDDVHLGMIWDDTKITEVEFNELRALFAKRVADYATTGTTSTSGGTSFWYETKKQQMVYFPDRDSEKNMLISLDGPVIESVRLYSFDPNGKTQEEVVGTRDVWLEVRVDGAADFCTVSNVLATGEETDTGNFNDFQTNTLIVPWKLTEGSGLKTVTAYCVKNSIPSHKHRDSIIVDTTAMMLITSLPDVITTRAVTTWMPMFRVRDRYSKVKYCQVNAEGLEGLMVREQCDDDSDGDHDYEDKTDDNKATLSTNYGPFVGTLEQNDACKATCLDRAGNLVDKGGVCKPSADSCNALSFNVNGQPYTGKPLLDIYHVAEPCGENVCCCGGESVKFVSEGDAHDGCCLVGWDINKNNKMDAKVVLDASYDENNDGLVTEADLGVDLDGDRKLDDTTALTEVSEIGAAKLNRYFWENAVLCETPFLEKADDYNEMSVTCKDELGNEAEIASMKAWRWSDTYPDFGVPAGFVFSTNRLQYSEPDEVSLWFEDESYGTGVKSPFSFSSGGEQFTLEATQDPTIFRYSFTAEDVDGLNPASCKWNISARLRDYTGKVVAEADAYTGDCAGEPVQSGNTREYLYECGLPLQVNAEHTVRITCADNTGKPNGRKTDEFKVTWDEEGPEISNFRGEKYGEKTVNAEGRFVKNLSPDLYFEVKDTYSSIESCTAQLKTNLGIGAKYTYTCVLNDKLTPSGDPYQNYKEVVCSQPVLDDAGANDLGLPVIITAFGNDTVELYCYDGVNNMNDLEETKQTLSGKLRIEGTPISSMLDDIYDACRMMRYGATAEQVRDAGWIDLGAPGVPAIDDKSALYDDEGITRFWRYEEDGKTVTREKIVSLFNNRIEDSMKIQHGPECLTEGACQIALQTLLNLCRTECEAANKEAPGSGAAVAEGTEQSIEQTTNAGPPCEGTSTATGAGLGHQSEGGLSEEYQQQIQNKIKAYDEQAKEAAAASAGSGGTGVVPQPVRLYTHPSGIKLPLHSTRFEQAIPPSGNAPPMPSEGMNEYITEAATGTVDFSGAGLVTAPLASKAITGLAVSDYITGYDVNLFAPKGEKAIPLTTCMEGDQEVTNAGALNYEKGQDCWSRCKTSIEKPATGIKAVAVSVLRGQTPFAFVFMRSWSFYIWRTMIGSLVVRGVPYMYATYNSWESTLQTRASHFMNADYTQCEFTENRGHRMAWWNTVSGLLPAVAVFKYFDLDEFDGVVCLNQQNMKGGKTYQMNVRVGRLDMGIVAGAGSVLSVCFDACNDYVCMVGIDEEPDCSEQINARCKTTAGEGEVNLGTLGCGSGTTCVQQRANCEEAGGVCQKTCDGTVITNTDCAQQCCLDLASISQDAIASQQTAQQQFTGSMARTADFTAV